MHSDADFLAAVAANPHDQLTRLVYADWLDEQGDPRGELVRIEEEVRFEPAWSEVLWSQKPRRNELRAKCDPAWLQAMRYGTDCLPLFYGRPFPDHWRDGWRLIREATERWRGRPMPDIGGHAEEVAEVEKRLGLTLPPSVREFVAFAHDLHRKERVWMSVFRDPYTMRMLPRHDAVSLILQAEGDIHWAVRLADLHLPDPPITTYYRAHEAEGDGEDEFVVADEIPEMLTRFLFDYAAGYASGDHSSMGVAVHDVDTLRKRLGESFPLRLERGRSTYYEGWNICIKLVVPGYDAEGHLDVRVSRSLTRKEIPAFLWEFTNGGGSFTGLFADEMHRRQPPPEWMRRHLS